MLGPATLAVAGLFAAIALQPVPGVAVTVHATAAPAISRSVALATVRLPTVEVIARRSSALAAIDRDDSRLRTTPKPRA
ncbi:MAG: hypothetical protein ABI585_09405 [Betaproteobacteria bacterium]